MNIAFVTREFPPSKRCGGIASYVWENSKYLSSLGHNIFIIAASDDVFREYEYTERDIKIIRLSGADFYINNSTSASVIDSIRSRYRSILSYRSYREQISKCLEKLISKHDIDVIEFPEFGNEALKWAHNKSSVPWIVRLHGSTFINRKTGGPISFFSSPLIWWFGKQELITLKKANAISSCGSDIAIKEAKLAGIDAKKITIIPNSINYSDWSKNTAQIIKSKSSPYKIFSAGTVADGKGYAELVEAVMQLKKKGINIKLTIAGKKGKLGRQIDKMISDSPFYRECICLMGSVDRSKLSGLYSTSDLVVFPSWWEPFGLVCIEAMAAGAIVLASSAGGMSEVIIENINGFLVTPKDSQILAEKIISILTIPNETKQKIRTNAAERIKEKYCHEKVIEMQLNFYKRVINDFHLPE